MHEWVTAFDVVWAAFNQSLIWREEEEEFKPSCNNQKWDELQSRHDEL